MFDVVQFFFGSVRFGDRVLFVVISVQHSILVGVDCRPCVWCSTVACNRSSVVGRVCWPITFNTCLVRLFVVGSVGPVLCCQ